MTFTVCDIENGPVETVDLPIEHGGSLHSFLYVYQRVPIAWYSMVAAAVDCQCDVTCRM